MECVFRSFRWAKRSSSVATLPRYVSRTHTPIFVLYITHENTFTSLSYSTFAAHFVVAEKSGTDCSENVESSGNGILLHSDEKSEKDAAQISLSKIRPDRATARALFRNKDYEREKEAMMRVCMTTFSHLWHRGLRSRTAFRRIRG